MTQTLLAPQDDNPPPPPPTSSTELTAIAEAWANIDETNRDTPSRPLADVDERLNIEWATSLALLDGLITTDTSRAAPAPTNERTRRAALSATDIETLEQLRTACGTLTAAAQTDEPITPPLIAATHDRLSITHPHAAEHAKTVAHLLTPPPDATPPEVHAAHILTETYHLNIHGQGTWRAATAAASRHLLREGLFPLAIRPRDAATFTAAMADATRGDHTTLARCIAASQRCSFLHAVALTGRNPKRATTLNDTIQEIAEQNRHRGAGYDAARQTAAETFLTARAHFAQTASDIRDMPPTRGPIDAFSDHAADSTPERRNWHRRQILQTARHAGYFASIENYSSWNRIGIATERGRTEILATQHGVGETFSGVIAVAVAVYRKRDAKVVDYHIASPEPFQINHKENTETTQRRYATWLTAATANAVNIWETLDAGDR